jgi:16S rRNA G966 N2-methylase RsmD
MVEANQYMNKKNALRDLTDEAFEILVPQLAKTLQDGGFIYNNSTNPEMLKDWNSLLKKKVDIHDDSTVIIVPATCTVGMKLMRHFMPHFYGVKNYKGVSVVSLWKKQHLEKALRFNRKYHSTPYISEIIRSLSFTNGLGSVTMYRPLMAKTIVSHFEAKSVLDVCAGWGGRMLGSVAAGNDITYTGIEPCTATYDGLCGMRELLSLDKRVTLLKGAAEQVLKALPSDQKFDIALTSPPYYNLEIYDDCLGDNSNQSMQYETYEKWIALFLEPVICEVLKRVKYSCWSVKNFKTDKKYNLMTDVVQIHEKYGWKMMPCHFSVKNSKRPGGTSGGGKVGTEEVTYTFACLCF